LGSNEKMRRLTGWSPRYTLADGIRETAAWFRLPENARRYKENVYNI
jgi:nucleoside-diphosphate-sugar epimerase